MLLFFNLSEYFVFFVVFLLTNLHFCCVSTHIYGSALLVKVSWLVSELVMLMLLWPAQTNSLDLLLWPAINPVILESYIPDLTYWYDVSAVNRVKLFSIDPSRVDDLIIGEPILLLLNYWINYCFPFALMIPELMWYIHYSCSCDHFENSMV